MRHEKTYLIRCEAFDLEWVPAQRLVCRSEGRSWDPGIYEPGCSFQIPSCIFNHSPERRSLHSRPTRFIDIASGIVPAELASQIPQQLTGPLCTSQVKP